MVPQLVSLALDYHRDPLAFRQLGEACRPLPDGFEDLFAEFCAVLAPARIAETAEQFAVEPGELEEAACFLVRHVLLNPESDHYRCLGLNRGAEPEAIRRHYQLLIRMFHPDRAEASTEFWAFHATRINLAYQTLRDAEARRDYDSGLPEHESRETTLAWFFRAQQPLIEFDDTKRPARLSLSRRSKSRPLWLYGLGLAVVAGSMLVLVSAMNREPALKLEAGRHVETYEAVPGYLADTPSTKAVDSPPADAGEPATAGLLAVSTEERLKPDRKQEKQEDRHTPPETSPSTDPVTRVAPVPKQTAPSQAEPRREPPKPVTTVATPAPTPPPAKVASIESKPTTASVSKAPSANPERAAQVVIDRLQGAYRNRDAAAFAALFTQRARVNEGQGRSLIHSKYADLFQRSLEARLYIERIDWRRVADDSLSGSGSCSVSIKYRDSNTWQYARGHIDFVLVRDGERYRIASMIYRIQ
ncbi:MAG: DnaJ domain-containing protein [Chromatiales bacterium]|nr:DnaJ domain-containing protein [Chromatiales bacterium]